MTTAPQYASLIKGFHGLESAQQMDLMAQSGLDFNELSGLATAYEADERLSIQGEIKRLEIELAAAKARLHELNTRNMKPAQKFSYQVARAQIVSSKNRI